MSKHTPGPWAYQEDSDAYTHIVRGHNNRFICQLAQTTSAEIEANARLIAAAPELLEALSNFPSDADYSSSDEFWKATVHWWLTEAAPVIAKATGEDQ
jgi:hypothetical protein